MKAVIVMDSGMELNLDEATTENFKKLLNKNGEITQTKPIIINNEKGLTTAILYPEHISHIHFIYDS